uniref:Ig-like domain-containing protein n=1 Tax=Podarcis muralis TaxID=64176 RepID=A0A670IH00_PODMU
MVLFLYILPGKSKTDAVVGTEVILTCPHQRPMIMVSWNANLKNGTVCYLSYISDRNQTGGNCSEDSMCWLSRPDKDSTLQIKSAQISSEGIYKCSTATADGTFSHEHNLTILVPPQASLIHDDINGTAICKAVAGKPAAQISWSPGGEYNTKSENLLNGTQTVTSIYKVNNSEGSKVTCFLSHPAWKESFRLSLGNPKNHFLCLLICGFHSLIRFPERSQDHPLFTHFLLSTRTSLFSHVCNLPYMKS